jgi:hypothetical protein
MMPLSSSTPLPGPRSPVVAVAALSGVIVGLVMLLATSPRTLPFPAPSPSGAPAQRLAPPPPTSASAAVDDEPDLADDEPAASEALSVSARPGAAQPAP